LPELNPIANQMTAFSYLTRLTMKHLRSGCDLVQVNLNCCCTYDFFTTRCPFWYSIAYKLISFLHLIYDRYSLGSLTSITWRSGPAASTL
jgi:hypothetical protein